MTEPREGTVSRRRAFAQLPDALVTDLRVTAVGVRLWARMDRYAGKDGRAFPSRGRLAEDLGVSDATIKRALCLLVDTGWIIRKERQGGVWDTELIDDPRVTSDPTPGHQRPDPRVTSDPTPGHQRPDPRVISDPHKETQRRRATKDTSADADDEFATFWATYPRKVGKGAARKAWTAATKVTSAATITAGADRYVAECRAAGTEPQYIAHPATWLRAERWADEQTTLPRSAQAGWGAYFAAIAADETAVPAVPAVPAAAEIPAEAPADWESAATAAQAGWGAYLADIATPVDDEVPDDWDTRIAEEWL